MANTNTAIEWTDATWNVVTGCDRVSAGCDHCYALDLAARLKAMGNVRYQNDGKPPTSGPGFGVTLHPDVLATPLQWRKPRRVFANSMSDLFHADVPTEFVARVFAVMATARRHTFQVLTKRPRRMQRVLTDDGFREAIERAADDIAGEHGWCHLDPPDDAWPLPNVWLGTSVENQEAAYRIDWLVKTPAAVRFLSCEPLIDRLSIEPWLWLTGPSTAGPWRDALGRHRGGGGIGGQMISSIPANDIHWVIAGGESGPRFRPLDVDWARDLRDQCQAAGVPFFFKQWGGRTPKAGGRLLDGREWNEMPATAVLA